MQRLMVFGLLLSLLCLHGCNLVGGAAQVFSPPELVEARYKLPDKQTLIVVDDPNQLVQDVSTLRRIAVSARTALEAEKVVTAGFVDQGELAALRAQLGPAYTSTSLAGLGITLEARQVIHAEVIGFQTNLAGDVVRPAIALEVKVFDLDQRARVFPAGADPDSGVDLGQSAYTVTTKLNAQDLTGVDAARAIAIRDLADTAGRDIARLFFDWRRPEPGSNLGQR